LFYLVSGLCHHPSKKIKEAAQKVEALFMKFGFSMFNKSYATGSLLLTSLLPELAKPEMQEAIAAIPGAADMVADNNEQVKKRKKIDKPED